MNIEIDKMTFEDLEIIKQDLSEKFDEFWTYRILKSELEDTNSIYIVAKNDNKIVGFAGIKLIFDEANIMNIVVKKEMRGKKIGSILLENLIIISKTKNAKTITLEVNVNNIPAISLYKKYNFTEIGRRKKYYNNSEDAIIMLLKGGL